MPSARLRPRCRYVTKHPPQFILDRLNERLNNNEIKLEGLVVQEHAFIRFPVEMQHYWSPEMHVWVREQDGETVIYGVNGPKPKIWTMFMFFYTAVLTSAFFGSSYGIIQMMLGMYAPFLWSIPAGIFCVIMVYGAAQYRQYKGKAQMEELRLFLDETVQI